MKLPITIKKKLKNNTRGISFFIWIWVDTNLSLKNEKITINHEKIHYKQQVELFFVFMWLLYGISYIVQYLKYKNHDDAYRNVIFEKEAYDNEKNLTYLKIRKLYGWKKYLN
jgi:hypothetical protein